MKKFLMIVLFLVSAVSLLAACAGNDVSPPQPEPPGHSIGTELNPPVTAEPQPPGDTSVDISTIKVIYSRIDWRDGMEDTTIVRSVDELGDYYEKLKAVNINDLDDDLTWRFNDGDYNDKFFEGQFLIMISVAEASGSNRHALSSIAEENNALTIHIDREVPDVGTMDMAGWLIIIELSNSYSITKADVIFTNVPISG